MKTHAVSSVETSPPLVSLTHRGSIWGADVETEAESDSLGGAILTCLPIQFIALWSNGKTLCFERRNWGSIP